MDGMRMDAKRCGGSPGLLGSHRVSTTRFGHLLPTLLVVLLAGTLRGASEEPIKVGVLHSLTGTMAISERSLVDAIQLAITEVNESGGVLGRPILPVIEDGASDWPTFAQKAEKLISTDEVCTIFGCWTSASRKAVLPVVERHNHLLWYPVQYEGQESSPNIIYTGAAPNQQIIPALKWCLEHLGTRVFLVGSDYVFPREANRIIREYLAYEGGTCVGEEYRPLGDKDFTNIVTKIRESKPDVVFNTVNGDSNVALFFALHSAGLGSDKLHVISVSIAEDELRSIGTTLTVGHYCAWNYFQSLDTPENHRFVEAFKKSRGEARVTSDPIEAAYFQVYLFARAVTRAGSTSPIRIREAAKGSTLLAPGGWICIDPENQHTWKTARIGEIQSDGQFRVVWSSITPIRPNPFPKPRADIPHSATQPAPSSAVSSGGVLSAATLIADLKADGLETRRRAALALRDLGPDAKPAAATLGNALSDQDWFVRCNAAAALSRIGLPAVDPLMSAMHSGDSTSKVLAASALGQIGPSAEKAVPALVRAYGSDDAELRREAVRALGRMGKASRSAKPMLVDALETSDTSVALLAAEALGEMGAEASSTLPALARTLGRGRNLLEVRALRAIDRITKDLQDERKTEALPAMEEARSLISGRGLKGPEIESLSRAIAFLQGIRSQSFFEKALACMVKYWWAFLIIIYLTAPLALYFIVLPYRPLLLFKWNTRLEQKLDFQVPEKYGGFTLPLRNLLWIGFLHHHPIVLNAWVEEHAEIYRRSFSSKRTFRERAAYVPVPIKLDEREDSKPSVESFRRVTSGGLWRLVIWGEGGVGKTTLACRIAAWAMDDEPQQRLCRDRLLLPVLIEPRRAPQAVENSPALEQAIANEFRERLGTTESIPDTLIRELLRTGRILVIIDDLSGFRKADWSPTKDLPIAALVVTSREQEALGDTQCTVVQPLRVSVREHLSWFIGSYLEQKKVRHEFNDRELDEAWDRLTRIAGQRGRAGGALTALFITMFLDPWIDRKLNKYEETTTADLPGNIPELMLKYLNWLNRRRQPTDPDDRTVQRASKIVAWEVIRENLRPGTARRADLLSALGHADAEALLAYLETQLGVVRVTGAAHNGVIFLIDPLAEYLAAMYLIEQFGADEKRWRDFLGQVDNRGAIGDSQDGFLRALWDCSLSYRRRRETPWDLSEQIARHAGLAPQFGTGEPVKVGVLHSLHGTMAISERSLVDAIQLAIKEINENGGVLGRPILPVVEDGASEEHTFARKADKLIVRDEVCTIFGCWTSASRKAVLPVVERHDHLLWYPVQYEGMESSPNIIYTGAAPNQQIIPALEWCLLRGWKRAFLVGSDYVFPREANRIIRAYLEHEGGACVGESYRPLGDDDFAGVIDMIRKAEPDIVFNTINGDSNIDFFRSLHRTNMGNAAVPVMSFSIAEDELRSIGTKFTAGHFCAWNYFQSVDTSANRVFVDMFKQAYGEDRVTGDPIEAAYSQVHLFARAASKAGSIDPRAIREAARGLKYGAPGGEVTIDSENQHTWKVAHIGEIQADGQFRIVWTSEEPIRPEPYPALLFPDGPPATGAQT